MSYSMDTYRRQVSLNVRFSGRSFGCRAADVGRKLPLRLAGVGVTAPCSSKINASEPRSK